MAEVHKKKVDKSIAIMLLFFCFLISLVNLLINSNSSTGGFVWIILLFILDSKKLSKLDFVLFGSIVVGIFLKFITIFYRNNHLSYVGNTCLLLFSLLAIYVYFKKGMHHEQN